MTATPSVATREEAPPAHTAPTAGPAVAHRPATVDRTFPTMGTQGRICATSSRRTAAELADAATRAERFVQAAAARLTRFDARSELRRLAAASATAPDQPVPVSPLLAAAVDIAIRAARDSGGLLDPTLAARLARAGYATTWDPARRLDLPTLLSLAPPRRPAAPAAAREWSRVSADRAAGAITLPQGVELDLGATAKGLVADLALRLLGPVDHGFVDLGGDLAIGGTHGGFALAAADPFGGPHVALEACGPCGVATSSIAARCWLGDPGPAHHLLDPSTGRPAFTGVVQATAAAPTTAEAERLAGQAVLAGPTAAAQLLARHGGLVVLDDATTIHLPGGLLR